ncbi:glutamine--scyllo-inositol transaminase [Hyaloraphidium curvatum]|nr:glutamine--scyllo-inositol transaminase [Hyaloraphidium curvatum]
MVEPALLASFRRVLHSGRYVLGPEVESFERAWAEYCGTVHCVGVASGLAALALMLAAPGIGEGDEVIVAANTYIATVLAVSRVGATPVFVEPDPATRNLDPAAAERAITPKTRAILSVDLYGHPAPYPELASLAARRNLLFFSDAAQSHGARVRGRPIASWCHAAAFSFYPSKNLGALGEAGAVVTSDPQLAEKIAALRNYGSRSRYVHDLVGSNERMDPLQAAFLMDKLPHLDALNARRREVARKYLDLLRGTPGLGLPPDPGPGDAEPSWHLFAATHPRRDALIAHLAGRGIDALVHYPVPPHLSGAYAGMGLGRGAFPAAEKLADEVVSLPCCPFMDDGMVGRVVEAVREFAGGDRGGEGS